MSQDKPLTTEEYVQKGGTSCPFCGATDITGGPVEIDAGIASQPVSCNECDKEWWDEYALTGYVE